MLNRADKEAIIAEIKNDLGKASGVFLTNLVGITANDAVKIRKDVRDAKGKMAIARNTLFARAAKGTSYEKLLSNLSGPHALAYAYGDAVAVVKTLKEAGESLELVQLKGGVLDGKDLTLAQLKELAGLPSKEQMLATLLATFMAPASAFVRVLHAVQESKAKSATAGA